MDRVDLAIALSCSAIVLSIAAGAIGIMVLRSLSNVLRILAGTDTDGSEQPPRRSADRRFDLLEG